MNIKPGTTFQPYGMDSVGRILEVKGGQLTWAYDHAPEALWHGSIKDLQKIGQITG